MADVDPVMPSINSIPSIPLYSLHMDIILFILLSIYFLFSVAIFLGIIILGIQRDRKVNSRIEKESYRDSMNSSLCASDQTDTSSESYIPSVILSFEGIQYHVVTAEKKRITILNGVSGYAKPGTITAVMGPSGCGKTTLLEVLCDRKKLGVITGDIMANGEPIQRTHLKRCSGFVMQSDCLLPRLTVRETFMYAADFRLDSSYSIERKRRQVDSIIKALELDAVAENRIGGSGSQGLSGGQKRRVTVGIELIFNPSIIFLDEPTSGLDASCSLQVIRVLRRLANEGRTIMLTIHQPRSDIFSHFDSLLLLKDGETMFFGSISQIPSYFSDVGRHLDPNTNPAEFVVDLTHDQRNHVEEDNEAYEEIYANLVERYKQSMLQQETMQVLKSLMDHTYEPLPLPLNDYYANLGVARYSTGFASQVFFLTHRAIHNDIRNTAFLASFVLGAITFLFYGILYVQVDTPSSSSMKLPLTDQYVMWSSITGIIFQVLAAASFLEQGTVAAVFMEKALFIREHGSGAYGSDAFHFAWFVRLLFTSLLKGVVFTPLFYFLSGFYKQTRAYFLFTVIVCLKIGVGSGLALLAAMLAPTLSLATGTFALISSIAGAISGYFISPLFMPPWLKWVYYINYFKYALEGCYTSQFDYFTLYDNSTDTHYPILNTVVFVDNNFNSVGNILILMIYPFIAHAFAFIATYSRTHGSKVEYLSLSILKQNSIELVQMQ